MKVLRKVLRELRGKHGTCGTSGAVPCRVAPLQRYLHKLWVMIGSFLYNIINGITRRSLFYIHLIIKSVIAHMCGLVFRHDSRSQVHVRSNAPMLHRSRRRRGISVLVILNTDGRVSTSGVLTRRVFFLRTASITPRAEYLFFSHLTGWPLLPTQCIH
ncbi:hypothetical protein ASPTUDRAFT_880762 [Aspergillus tubingensis CBS 134.48]|uniref:Uncharacterized protein n=1 Tax=Aspergillus tubingensis (strain CBS 134.48) TaxID=767770 RepID=A0A1L9MQU7_ASPTC|nr:hypothetical protein ASPTUDRAFT_880762 [Aspergillus tubingensis CBS 134.48]